MVRFDNKAEKMSGVGYQRKLEGQRKGGGDRKSKEFKASQEKIESVTDSVTKPVGDGKKDKRNRRRSEETHGRSREKRRESEGGNRKSKKYKESQEKIKSVADSATKSVGDGKNPERSGKAVATPKAKTKRTTKKEKKARTETAERDEKGHLKANKNVSPEYVTDSVTRSGDGKNPERPRFLLTYLRLLKIVRRVQLFWDLN